MNLPSTLGCNWQWRMTGEQFSSLDRDRIRYYTTIYGRMRQG